MPVTIYERPHFFILKKDVILADSGQPPLQHDPDKAVIYHLILNNTQAEMDNVDIPSSSEGTDV